MKHIPSDLSSILNLQSPFKDGVSMQEKAEKSIQTIVLSTSSRSTKSVQTDLTQGIPDA